MLSGGQKQRLAIARSIISNPRVLLLDEATSALDANAEHIVQQGLNNIAMDRTMVVIAHNLSTIRNADNIVVMSKGQIVEQGTHSELIELGGTYTRLVSAQNLGQEGNGEEAKQETETEGNCETVALTKSMSTTDRQVSDLEAAKVADLNYNLLKCLAIIIIEQRRLWFPFAILGIAAAIGGAYLSCHPPCRNILISSVRRHLSRSCGSLLPDPRRLRPHRRCHAPARRLLLTNVFRHGTRQSSCVWHARLDVRHHFPRDLILLST